MSKMQRQDDIGTILRFLSHFLRVDMHELWRHHRPNDFGQPEKEPRRSRSAASGDGIVTIVRSLEVQSQFSDHPINRQPIIAALKNAGSTNFNFSPDQQARSMQIMILRNIAVELENGNARPEPISLPPA